MEYWIIINGAACGPYQLQELTARGCTASTPVWREGLQAWSPAATVPELQPMFAEPTVIDVHAEEATFPETPEELQRQLVEQSEEAYRREERANDINERWRHAQQGSHATPPPLGGTQQPRYQQAPYQQSYTDPRYQLEPCPPTYLGWNIAATLLCCILTGIFGIIASGQVKSRWEAGDYVGAKKASERAAGWLIAGVVIGIIASAFSVVFTLSGGI
ncbi:MAG: CD225/dispanin family protein [Bacteroidales bacterium]|nr:CD225/dispanin family protein [Bacteroidales bacterium]MCD8394827.1 CD225/dispanin family protein [Bacteroidales bacterium]